MNFCRADENTWGWLDRVNFVVVFWADIHAFVRGIGFLTMAIILHLYFSAIGCGWFISGIGGWITKDDNLESNLKSNIYPVGFVRLFCLHYCIQGWMFRGCFFMYYLITYLVIGANVLGWGSGYIEEMVWVVMFSWKFVWMYCCYVMHEFTFIHSNIIILVLLYCTTYVSLVQIYCTQNVDKHVIDI